MYDTLQVYLYLIDDLHMDPKHITIMGDTAGGGLCMALSLYLRDHGAPLPEAMVMMNIAMGGFDIWISKLGEC